MLGRKSELSFPSITLRDYLASTETLLDGVCRIGSYAV